MRQGGHILARVLHQVAAAVRPGISTLELNDLAERGLRELGASPSFLRYGEAEGNPFPASLCTSIDATVVHGIPTATVMLKPGQIIGLDLGCWYQGLCTDMAITVPVGAVSPLARKLIKIAQQSLEAGLKQVCAGAKLGDISHAIQTLVEANGFSVVRQLTGHGVGKEVHEEPPVPNFGSPGTGLTLPVGATLAIEPMVNQGGAEVGFLPDGWTVVTADGSLSSHFEHTVVVTKQGCEVLTKV